MEKMEKKFVYSFNEGSKDMKMMLGGKGANLAEMDCGLIPLIELEKLIRKFGGFVGE